MSKVKYRVREYNPTSAQQGSHSFFAEAVINNEITNNELADKIAARTGVKAYEVTTVIAAIADIISEEVLESNRISLADHTGTKMVSIYPKVNGSVSDADIERELKCDNLQLWADLKYERRKCEELEIKMQIK